MKYTFNDKIYVTGVDLASSKDTTAIITIIKEKDGTFKIIDIEIVNK